MLRKTSQGLLNMVLGDSGGKHLPLRGHLLRLALGGDCGKVGPEPLAQLSGSLGF